MFGCKTSAKLLKCIRRQTNVHVHVTRKKSKVRTAPDSSNVLMTVDEQHRTTSNVNVTQHIKVCVSSCVFIPLSKSNVFVVHEWWQTADYAPCTDETQDLTHMNLLVGSSGERAEKKASRDRRGRQDRRGGSSQVRRRRVRRQRVSASSSLVGCLAHVTSTAPCCFCHIS